MKEKDRYILLSIVLFVEILALMIFIYCEGDMCKNKILCFLGLNVVISIVLFIILWGANIAINWICNYTGEPVHISKEDLHYKSKFKSAKEIYIDKDVANIPYKYFSDFENLQCVVFEGENTAISPSAFKGCKNLERVYLPSKLTKIRHETFYGCSNLRSVIIPNSVTSIDTIAFSGCCNVETLVIGDGITSFLGLPIKQSLKFVLIGNGIKRIEYGTFKNCEKLEEIIIPKSVTKIGAGAFKDCKKLKSVTFEGEGTWFYTDKNDYTGGTEETLNAENLKNTHCDKYWYKQQTKGGGK